MSVLGTFGAPTNVKRFSFTRILGGRFHVFFSNRDFHIILDLDIKRGKKLQWNNTACKKPCITSHKQAERTGAKLSCSIDFQETVVSITEGNPLPYKEPSLLLDKIPHRTSHSLSSSYMLIFAIQAELRDKIFINNSSNTVPRLLTLVVYLK